MDEQDEILENIQDNYSVLAWFLADFSDLLYDENISDVDIAEKAPAKNPSFIEETLQQAKAVLAMSPFPVYAIDRLSTLHHKDAEEGRQWLSRMIDIFESSASVVRIKKPKKSEIKRLQRRPNGPKSNMNKKT